MNKQEWQIFHGFSDEDMERIELLVKTVNGKITEILTRAKND